MAPSPKLERKQHMEQQQPISLEEPPVGTWQVAADFAFVCGAAVAVAATVAIVATAFIGLIG
jgi:hypothetical protein